MSPPAEATQIAISPSPQRDELLRLVDGLDAAALHWLAGYAAGRASNLAQLGVSVSRTAGHGGVQAAAPVVTPTLTVLYGSQTGNAKRIAEALGAAAEAAGHGVRVVRADRYSARELKNERLLYIAISTHGDGDPPDDALRLLDELAGRRAPKLDGLGYAVFALGDSSYPNYCAVGRRIDARLAELGGERLLPLTEADLDFEPAAADWQARSLKLADERLARTMPRATVTPLRPQGPALATRQRPVLAEVIENQRITGRDSHRDVRHIELAVDGVGLDYQPGDALGVWPENPPALVAELLDLLGLDGGTEVEHQGVVLPLQQWLAERRELTRLSRPMIAAQAERAGDQRLQALLEPAQSVEFGRYLEAHQVIDLLQQYPAHWSAGDLVAALRPLTPRLYSIASSQRHVGDGEVHLTVAHIAYVRDGQSRWGAASHWLAGRAPGERVRVYVEANERFRLPDDPGRDLIMIGPGTGIAPFRAFIQERAEAGACGRHWLLFGDRHFQSDFLYQVEWQQALGSGLLARLDLAFSRDQAERIHVQQRLREHGRDVHAWIEGGAHVYVCGATAMARDVHQTLIDILAEHGGVDRNAAERQLNELSSSGRYARDVY